MSNCKLVCLKKIILVVNMVFVKKFTKDYFTILLANALEVKINFKIILIFKQVF